MSVKVIKVETNEYRILVQVGDEELARKEAFKAALSAEEARLSAIAADESEQVAIEEAGKSFVSATESVESAAAAEAAKNQIVDKINFANAQAGDLLQNVADIFVPQRPDLAIVSAFYRIQTALIPRLIQHEGINITGNGALTNFTDPISGLSYKIFSGLVANTTSSSAPAIVYVNGFDPSTGGPTNKGIILGIDSLNYIELFWNRSNVCVFRRIVNGSVVLTQSIPIGNFIRAAPYQVAINIGGALDRTSIGAVITSATRASFSFEDISQNYRRNITFIAMTDNIVGSVNNNICIAGKKFI